jgi:hypothetical protein
LQGEEAECWTLSVQKLKQSAIRLREEEDEIVWSKNNSSGRYTTQLGYKAMFRVEEENDRKWWWKSVWKIKSPIKQKVFLWLVLANKILTWDNCKKRAWHGT